MAKRDPRALTGALFVVLVLVAFIPLGGDTPNGDASAQKVVSYYSDHDTQGDHRRGGAGARRGRAAVLRGCPP